MLLAWWLGCVGGERRLWGTEACTDSSFWSWCPWNSSRRWSSWKGQITARFNNTPLDSGRQNCQWNTNNRFCHCKCCIKDVSVEDLLLIRDKLKDQYAPNGRSLSCSSLVDSVGAFSVVSLQLLHVKGMVIFPFIKLRSLVFFWVMPTKTSTSKVTNVLFSNN